MFIGGMQLPKRGSSGSYRDLRLTAMYSNANAIEPSNTSTQPGGQAPIRPAAVMPAIEATRPKIHFALLERLETKPRGVIVCLAGASAFTFQRSPFRHPGQAQTLADALASRGKTGSHRRRAKPTRSTPNRHRRAFPIQAAG